MGGVDELMKQRLEQLNRETYRKAVKEHMSLLLYGQSVKKVEVIVDECYYICECGAHSAGIEAHSTWCPIYKQEETG